MAWSVLIVDDHAGFRSGARALLEADGFDVLGEAADGESAVEQARRLRPQVVLLDVQLPGIDGFAVAESLAAEPSGPAGRLHLEPRAKRLPKAAGVDAGARIHHEIGVLGGVPQLAAGLTPPPAAIDLAGRRGPAGGGSRGWPRAARSRTGPLLAFAGLAWLAGDVWTSSRTRIAVRSFMPSSPIRPGGRVARPGGADRAGVRRWADPRPRAGGVADDRADGARRRAPPPCAGRGSRPRTPCARRVPRGLHRDGGAPISRPLGISRTPARTPLAAWLYDAAIGLTAWPSRPSPLGRPRAQPRRGSWSTSARPEPQALRAALARTVGDPSLQSPTASTSRGSTRRGARSGSPRVARDARGPVVEDADRRVAALVHDPAALRDPTLSRSVDSALRLALANVRLQADVAARLARSRSRRRLVEAAHAERRRLREQLAAGAEGHLAARRRRRARRQCRVPPRRRCAPSSRTPAPTSAASRRAHPRALTEHGLSAALGELAAQTPVTIELTVPPGRFAAPRETAAYFVCSEALANVAKYAPGAHVRIAVSAGADGCGSRSPMTVPAARLPARERPAWPRRPRRGPRRPLRVVSPPGAGRGCGRAPARGPDSDLAAPPLAEPRALRRGRDMTVPRIACVVAFACWRRTSPVARSAPDSRSR